MIIRRQGDWLSAKVGDDFIMMSAEKGSYISLGEVAARIWELIDEPRSLEDICARLVQEFEVTPSVCRAEVEVFLNEMKGYGSVALDSAQAV